MAHRYDWKSRARVADDNLGYLAIEVVGDTPPNIDFSTMPPGIDDIDEDSLLFSYGTQLGENAFGIGCAPVDQNEPLYFQDNHNEPVEPVLTFHEAACMGFLGGMGIGQNAALYVPDNGPTEWVGEMMEGQTTQFMFNWNNVQSMAPHELNNKFWPQPSSVRVPEELEDLF